MSMLDFLKKFLSVLYILEDRYSTHPRGVAPQLDAV